MGTKQNNYWCYYGQVPFWALGYNSELNRQPLAPHDFATSECQTK